MTGFICIVSDTKPNLVFPVSVIRNRTVAELAAEYMNNSKIVGYCTKNYILPIKDDSILINEYPNLILKERPEPYIQPDFYIKEMPLYYVNHFAISVNVVTDEKVPIPSIFIKLKDKYRVKIQTLQLCNKVSKKFDIPHISQGLFIGEIPLDPESEIRNILEAKNATFHCSLLEKGNKIVNHRANIISEIVATEEVFINDLQQIINYWQPNLAKILDQNDQNLVFKDFPMILGCHSQFLNTLLSLFNGYATEVADLFLQFVQFFKVSMNFIINYPRIIDLFNARSKSFSNKLAELQFQLDGRDLLTFLITPVQRLPRYLLFLKQLIEHTPKSHPDAIRLQRASESINSMTHQIDISSKKAQNLTELLKIQQKIKNDFAILSPSRTIVSRSVVKIDEDLNGSFIICNDIVVLMKTSKKGSDVLFDVPIDGFSYSLINEYSIIVTPSKKYKKVDTFTSVSVGLRNKAIINDYKVTFQTAKSFEEFFQNIDKTEKEFCNSPGNNNETVWRVRWEKVDIKLPELESHCAIVKNGALLVFGGRQGNTIQRPSNRLYVAVLKQKTCEATESFTSPRLYPTINLVRKRLFIIGGLNNKEKTPKQIIEYDCHRNLWSFVIKSTKTDFSGRYMHTTITINYKLYIFGGKNWQLNILNDLYIFNPHDHSFIHENTPLEARYKHAACNINEHKMMVFGGKTMTKNGILNDFWIFDTNSHKWTKFETVNIVAGRYSHSMFFENRKLFILGGFFADKTPATPIVIDIDKKDVVYPLVSGNIPWRIKNTCFAQQFDTGTIYSVCGKFGTQKKSFGSVFSIKIFSNEDVNLSLLGSKAINPSSPKLTVRKIVKRKQIENIKTITNFHSGRTYNISHDNNKRNSSFLSNHFTPINLADNESNRKSNPNISSNLHSKSSNLASGKNSKNVHDSQEIVKKYVNRRRRDSLPLKRTNVPRKIDVSMRRSSVPRKLKESQSTKKRCRTLSLSMKRLLSELGNNE
ncbi:hypothetical protein TRFO_39071 [Tritrichomonas foetus]|uniref:DH domain-containing protein n=1 Tax=Tritrichomonas foetus TaxID=1144522 RepID=A0A1J4JAN6_9EUKA|nr:hypothetical protein TRFO_39071 [Tritrichomonas foetus]|eukprot:OHS94723.1 hypothetical protein TRFO_39071 [Tritrichomonas foetus]